MLQACLTGGSGILPSIEDRRSTAQISEVPEQKKKREKEKIKPRIKSDVLIKASESTMAEGREQESERKKTWLRSNEPGFTPEEIAMFPDKRLFVTDGISNHERSSKDSNVLPSGVPH